jgi:hypothetical protein
MRAESVKRGPHAYSGSGIKFSPDRHTIRPLTGLPVGTQRVCRSQYSLSDMAALLIALRMRAHREALALRAAALSEKTDPAVMSRIEILCFTTEI